MKHNKSSRKARKQNRKAQRQQSIQQQGLLYDRKSLADWAESWFVYLDEQGREDEAIAALEASVFFEKSTAADFNLYVMQLIADGWLDNPQQMSLFAAA